MTALSLLSLLTRFFFLALGILTLVNYVRRRDAINRDTALAFGAIALNIVITMLSDMLPTIPSFLRAIGTLALIAQPYLLLRLADYLQVTPIWIRRAGWMSMLLSWIGILIYTPSSLPVPATLVIVGYFVIFNGYVMLVFTRGVAATSGMTQRRLQLCSWGSGLFALALLFIGFALILPVLQTELNVLIQLSAVTSASAFLLGFAPPKWLHYLWQFAELRQYLSQISITSTDHVQILRELSQTAKRAVGGLDVVVLERNATQEQWSIIADSNSLSSKGIPIEDGSVIQHVWQNKIATYVVTGSELNNLERDLLNIVGAESLIIVPVSTKDHMFAILLVFLKHRSLFPQDDMELLKLLAQQSAIFLENAQLLNQLQQRLEMRFERVLDTIAEAVISINRSQHILLFNRSAERIFGYTAEEVLGQSLDMLLPPDVVLHHQSFVSDFAQRRDVARGMGERRTSLSAKHKNGSIFPIEASISKLTEGDDVILTVFIRDISVQIQAEAARRDMETRFTRVLDTMAEAMISIDRSQHILLFNQSAERVFGYASEEALGQKLDMLLPPDVVQRHKSFVDSFADGQDIARGMGQRDTELFARHKDGYIFPIEASISRLTDSEDVILTVFIRDISEQKRTQEALRESEGRYQRIIDNMLEGFQIIDFDWTYLYVNQSAAQYGRLPKEDLIGYTLMEKYPGIETTEMFATLEYCMDKRVAQHADFEFVYPDGDVAWFTFSIQPIPDGIFVLSLEITERKKAEQAMQQLNEELEQRVKERTAHLEAVNGELEAFSYSVSHDLRAPLRALDGFSQAIVEDYHDVLDEDGQEYLDLIRFESQRMGQLIDDLIDLSRFTRTELHREQVNLSRMAEAICQKLQVQDPQRDGDFVIQPDLMACADERLMQVVLENLLSNAWKYSVKEVRYRIELGSREEEGESLYFVRDNGAGFDMAYVHKLFGAFQRLHAATEYEGTGIGLATIQRIIHRHGGHIRAEGAVDAGASFYFTLGNNNCD